MSSAPRFAYAVGQRAQLTRSFDAREVAEFAALVGGGREHGRGSEAAADASARSDDAGEHVPSGLIGALFSTLLGTELPGRGTNWMKQTLRFRARARVGERLTASVEIVRLRPEKKLVNLRVVCEGAAGAMICEGEALVLALEMAPPAND